MNKSGIFIGLLLIVVFVLAIVGLSVVDRVDPGEAGVIITYRRGEQVLERPIVDVAPVAEYFFVNPITERVAKYPTAQQTLDLKAVIEGENVVGGDAAKCSDSGGIPLWINTTVLWRVNPDEVGELYLLRPGYALDTDNDDNESDDGDIEATIVLQSTINAISLTCGEFTYDTIFGSSKSEFRLRVIEILNESLRKSHIILDDFLLGDINSTSIIESSLNEKSAAQQSAQAAEFEAEQARTTAQGQADAAVIAAQGRADAVLIEAVANAEAIVVEAEARAEAIDLITEKLAEYGVSLVEWQWLENWDGQTPETLVITDESGSPLLTIDLQPTPTPEE